MPVIRALISIWLKTSTTANRVRLLRLHFMQLATSANTPLYKNRHNQTRRQSFAGEAKLWTIVAFP